MEFATFLWGLLWITPLPLVASQYDMKVTLTMHHSSNYKTHVPLGEEFSLECEVQSVAPVNNLTIIWFRWDTELQRSSYSQFTVEDGDKDQNVTVRANLSITACREDHRAFYSCAAQLDLENTTDTTSNIVQLEVLSMRGCPVGQEFMTTFLKNFIEDSAKLELAITAHEKTATVNVWSPLFTWKGTVPKGNTRRLNLPATAELSDPGSSTKVVSISSDSDITVVTSNMKNFTGDSSVILPTSKLGRKYVVFTPDTADSTALVALVNGDKENVVEILPAADMDVKGRNDWKSGITFTLKLKPNEVYQFMSQRSFTGTRITSTLPLAVLVGDECAVLVGNCQHVYEQLLPVESFSDHYLVPAMLNLNNETKDHEDYAYVVAADDMTTVTIFGKEERAHKLHAGEKLEIPMRQGEPVIVRSNKKVMVMYFGSNLPNDEFLTNILPTSEMSNTWSVYSQETFENTAVIVSEAEGSNTISGVTNWRPFPSDSRYVWAMKRLGNHKGPVSISGEVLMSVYVFGGKIRDGYGTTGVCTSDKPLKPRLVSLNHNVILTEGDRLELSCTADNFKDNIGYVFRRNNKTLKATRNPIFLIESVEMDSAGVYECIIFSNGGEASAEIRVDVRNKPLKPRLVSLNHNAILTEGDRLELSCTADAYPSPSYQWRHNNKTLEYERKATLLVESVEMDSAGVYECIIRNTEGEESVEIRVAVRNKAREIIIDNPRGIIIDTPRAIMAGVMVIVLVVLLVVVALIWRKHCKRNEPHQGESTYM